MSRPKPEKRGGPFAQPDVPLLMLAAFVLGAGGMWVIMRTSSSPSSPPKPAVKTFVPSPAVGSAATEPPDVSQLPPAEAARTLADWNYDHQNWAHAIDHYEQAIARGADNADVRTDLGNCYRFLGQPQKALEQYELAQRMNPLHENSLYNQIGLFAEVLHDNGRAIAAARDFIARFPQSPRAEAARKLMGELEGRTGSGHSPAP